MVESLQDYRESGVHTRLARIRGPLITPHPLYLATGGNPSERALAYRQWLDTGIAPDDLQRLRAHAS